MQEEALSGGTDIKADQYHHHEFQAGVGRVTINHGLKPEYLREVLAIIDEHVHKRQREEVRIASEENALARKVEESLEPGLEHEELAAAFQQKGTDELTGMPGTEAEVRTWYFDRLDDYRRTYACVLAALNGAPVNVVMEKVKELYSVPLTPTPSEPEIEEEERESPKPPVALPRRDELLQSTWTKVVTVRDIPRLYWQDTTPQGASQLALTILKIAAEEATFALEENEEKRFIHSLESWPETLKGDAFWRAARALGVVHWWQGIDIIRNQFLYWANNPSPLRLKCAASYMVGMYVYKPQLEGIASDAPAQRVKQLLRDWTRQVMERRQLTLGLAIVRTYGFIAYEDPETALAGLDILLGFTDDGLRLADPGAFESIYRACTTQYIVPLWRGHLRMILTRLGKYAAQFALESKRGSTVLREKRQQNILEIFTIVCASASAGSQSTVYVPTVGTLPETINLRSHHRRELILAGVIAEKETAWRSSVCAILATFIGSGNQHYTLETLLTWANLLVKEQHSEALERYISFFQEMVKLLTRWVEQGSIRRDSVRFLTISIREWKTKYRREPLGAFADKLLDLLLFS